MKKMKKVKLIIATLILFISASAQIQPKSISGNGTINYVTKFTDSKKVSNSQIFDNGSRVYIGLTSGSYQSKFVVKSTGSDLKTISIIDAGNVERFGFGITTSGDAFIGTTNGDVTIRRDATNIGTFNAFGLTIGGDGQGFSGVRLIVKDLDNSIKFQVSRDGEVKIMMPDYSPSLSSGILFKYADVTSPSGLSVGIMP